MCFFLLESIWACTPGKPGCTPQGVSIRPHSCPFEPVRPNNLALCPALSIYVLVLARFVPFGAYLCLHTKQTLLYARGHVCTSPFVPVRACPHRKPGFTRGFENARARCNPFGPVRLENRAVRPWACVYVLFGAYLGLCARKTWLYDTGRVYTSPFVPVWAYTPSNLRFTPGFAYERARSCPFGPVGLENLAVRP